MSTEQWRQTSRILHFIMQQNPKPIKESPGVGGEPAKPKRTTKMNKEKQKTFSNSSYSS
jgi:hypothetical protein